MELSDDEARIAFYAVRDLCARRHLGGQPVHKKLAELHNRLRSCVSETTADVPCHNIYNKQKYVSSTTEDHRRTYWRGRDEDRPDLINVQEAAEILGVSTQYIRRISADLDGWKVGRQWCFERQSVVAYATSKKGALKYESD